MKKILILVLLFAALSGNAQTDTTEIQTDSVEVQIITFPHSTPVGAPNGKLVSKEIGPSGGEIISDDGKVEMIFPKDALTETKVISIQPTTSSLPNSGDKAYQFEPSGLQFIKPVELIFHYTKEEAETCPPYLKFMAIQSSNGKWEFLDYENWDSMGNSLRGLITHFSAFLDGNLIELSPVEKTLKVGQTLNLFLTAVTPPFEAAPGEDDLPGLPPRAPHIPGRSIIWSVNGGHRYGTIRQQPSKYSATYTAPTYLPDGDTKVFLKVTETTIRTVVQRSRNARRWVGTTRIPTTTNLATFTCNIKLYDEYKIVAISKWIPESCGKGWIDSSNFVARLYSHRVELSEVINRPPTITQTQCKMLTYLTEGCVGPVHINSELVTDYTINRSNPPKIEFHFQPVEVLYARGYATVGAFRGPTKDYPGNTSISKVHFIANRTAQIISLGGSVITSSLKVEPF